LLHELFVSHFGVIVHHGEKPFYDRHVSPVGSPAEKVFDLRINRDDFFMPARERDPRAAMRRVLESRDRGRAGVTAPPQGLCLEQVFYPPEAA